MNNLEPGFYWFIEGDKSRLCEIDDRGVVYFLCRDEGLEDARNGEFLRLLPPIVVKA